MPEHSFGYHLRVKPRAAAPRGHRNGSRGRRPIRLGFVVRSFTYGGAEHDIVQLITQSDPTVLQVVGMAVQMPYPICPELDLNHPRVPPIYQPRAVTRHPHVIEVNSFAEAIRPVAASVDILVAWGVPDLADLVPLDFRGRIVVTSKASGSYQESFLHDNSLLTSDYVANSVKSVEAFPGAVQHRVRVIYPGIEPRRIERQLDRDELRAEWGLQPEDPVVGYLGRIAPDKGIEKLARAVRTMDPRWKAVFVGRNGNFPDYERQFARLCRRVLPGRHAIVDWTTAIGDALSAFDVLAYPTEDEGFSNTLAEAWLLGVPTVATAGVGALAESRWAECSATVPPDFTLRELSHALEVACGNEKLIAHARRRAEALTIQATIDDWQKYFTELADQSRRTRVLVLVPNLLTGGIPSWLITLMRHTPEIDWCCVCVLSEISEYAADREVVEAILQRGCPIMGIPRVPPKQTQRRLLRAIRQTRPDVVLQCGVKRLDQLFPDTDVPLVTVSHGPAVCGWARDVLSQSCRVAARRVAISATSRDAYPASHRTGVTIISNGVHIPSRDELPRARREARRELGIASTEIAVGFVGRLSPEKNPVRVAQAVALLPPAYRAVFIGPDCARLRPAIRRITPQSVHVGPASPQAVERWIPALDVLVCPSDYESFGLAMAEAWAAMVPVVSTPVGVVAERSDGGEIAVVVPLNPDADVLASAIRQAHAERQRRVHRCRELVAKDYDARIMGQNWQTFLQTLPLSPARRNLMQLPEQRPGYKMPRQAKGKAKPPAVTAYASRPTKTTKRKAKVVRAVKRTVKAVKKATRRKMAKR